ncbi:MAG TPA: LysM peptidoglycan-binding domain-containing protein [Desulfuromonadales bacterium]|nr:LysM peptidoglycan-binding domain-containing protein [Desulfuromonadales bacterium]
MFQCTFFRSTFIAAAVVNALLYVSAVQAAMDAQYEIDPAALADTPAKAKRPSAKKHRPAVVHGVHSRSSRTGTPYTVKSGDHLFKILMRDFGLSNEEADVFIDEIRRENNIYDIKRLKIGQTILIPPIQRGIDGRLKLSSAATLPHAAETAPRQTFSLSAPSAPLSEQEAVTRLQAAWDTIIPRTAELQKPLSLQTDTFSLTLDPSRYPAFAGMNGGRILLDQTGTIPPLVKALIEEKDPLTRIVSAHPLATNRSLSTLLSAAGFYSVEENFSLDFGSDPTLTVHADFKVEKKADSLIAQDVVLVNSAAEAAPAALSAFLKKEGFALHEPFATAPARSGHVSSRSLSLITASGRDSLMDAILASLSVTADRDRRLEVFAADTNGISLSVKAERYFEKGGQRYVVSHFDGNPVNYTLFRILETMGFKVVILNAKDDFRAVTEKIIARMKLNGEYSRQTLLKDKNGAYAIHMSGFSVDEPSRPEGGVFITDRPLDRIIQDLLTANGYSITIQ